jgi:hypothetical protein
VSTVQISFVKNILDEDKATLIGDRWYRQDLPAGSAEWINGTDGAVAGLTFVCPCGCGNVGHVPVREGYGGHVWKWNGDRKEPTLTPSIQRTSGCKWHGFLNDGLFTPV